MATTLKEEKSLVYLNTAAAGLLSPASASAATRFQQIMIDNPAAAFMQWMEESLPVLREKVAKLLVTTPPQVAFAPNFSYALFPVIQSVQPSVKKVLLFKNDYPSLTMPFELGGFDVHYVESPDGFTIPIAGIKEIAEREKIELIAVSHVQFLTGFTIDLKALGDYCKEKHILLIVDATQSMGAVNLDFDALSVDVLISSSYKWLNGGYGSAVLCMKEAFLDRFPPKIAGFGNVKPGPQGWSYQPSIRCYEPGHLNVPGLLQLEQAVDQRILDGVEAVEKHNAALLRLLARGLAQTSFKVYGGGPDLDNLSTMLCIEAAKETGDGLSRQGFALTWRQGLIRVSPHFYNTEKEIARFIAAMDGYSEK